MMQAADKPVPLHFKIFIGTLGLAGAAAGIVFGAERSMPWILALAAVLSLLPDRTPQGGRSANNPLFLRVCGFVMFASLASSFWIR